MNIGHNSQNFDIDELPVSLQAVAENLGMGMVFAIMEHFAGVELRIPHKLKPDHKLMVLGQDQAEALCLFFPRETILVPVTLDPGQLRRKVQALEDRGLKRWEIARELRISQRHVRRLANTQVDDPNQLGLFD